MNKSISTYLLVIVAFVAIAAVLLFPSATYSQEASEANASQGAAAEQSAESEGEQEEAEDALKFQNMQTRRRRTASPECNQRQARIQERFEEEDWAGAEQEARSALRRACRPGFEHSEIYNWIGVALFQQEKIPEAIEAYLTVVTEPEADPDKRVRVRFNMAQLMFMQEDYDNSIKHLETWMKESETIDRGGKILLAKAYYNVENKERALELVEEVMAESREMQSVPKEGWLSFQWVLYYEKNEYRKAIGVSHALLTYYPEVKYWKQLTAMFGALEDEKNELLGLEIAYMQNGLDEEKQLMALAYRYLAFDTPFRAAYLIEKGMEVGMIERTQKNLEVLGSAWQRSQEFGRASPILEEAAALSEDGNVWSRLAGVYLNINENQRAYDAAVKALAKGNLKREDLTWMNKGNAEAAMHCYKDAEKSFTKAASFPKTETGATNWKNYVVAEGQRRANLVKRGARLDGCLKS